MGTRTVRLDEETEKTLAMLTKLTGLTILELLRHGVPGYCSKALEETARKPYEIFQQLDLGSGGYARVPAEIAKTTVGDIIRKKPGR